MLVSSDRTIMGEHVNGSPAGSVDYESPHTDRRGGPGRDLRPVESVGPASRRSVQGNVGGRHHGLVAGGGSLSYDLAGFSPAISRVYS